MRPGIAHCVEAKSLRQSHWLRGTYGLRAVEELLVGITVALLEVDGVARATGVVLLFVNADLTLAGADLMLEAMAAGKPAKLEKVLYTSDDEQVVWKHCFYVHYVLNREWS